MGLQDYEKPSVTTDIVLFRVCEKEGTSRHKNNLQELQVLLVKRDSEPQKDFWSLPGGFVNMYEDIYQNVKRKLQEKTGVHGEFYLEQLCTLSDINRDSRGRVISVSFVGLCNQETYVQEKTETCSDWVSVKDVLDGKHGQLAFDHLSILLYAFDRIKNKLEYTDIVFNLFPQTFTIASIQSIYETFVGHNIDNFRRKIKEYVQDTGKISESEGKSFRRPTLYCKAKQIESKF